MTEDYSVWGTRELIAEVERLSSEVRDREHYTIMSICRDNLGDIGVANSKNISDTLMKKIVSRMQEKYDYYSHEETFIEYLEQSVDALGIERIEV